MQNIWYGNRGKLLHKQLFERLNIRYSEHDERTYGQNYDKVEHRLLYRRAIEYDGFERQCYDKRVYPINAEGYVGQLRRYFAYNHGDINLFVECLGCAEQ